MMKQTAKRVRKEPSKPIQQIIVREDAALLAMRNRLIEQYMTDDATPLKMITCDTCLLQRKCEYVYDPFNVNGDCVVAANEEKVAV
jgi:hypothetical protein